MNYNKREITFEELKRLLEVENLAYAISSSPTILDCARTALHDNHDHRHVKVRFSSHTS